MMAQQGSLFYHSISSLYYILSQSFWKRYLDTFARQRLQVTWTLPGLSHHMVSTSTLTVPSN